MVQSRLHRRLSPNGAPLFSVAIASRPTQYDDTIKSISISHGKDGTAGGLTPATCELETVGQLNVSFNRSMTVRMSSELASRIAAYNPRVTASLIRDRFRGRVGSNTIRDRGDHLNPESRIQGSSWSALLSASKRKVAIPANRQVQYQIRDFMNDPALGSRIPLDRPAEVSYDVTVGDEESATFSDKFAKYSTDLGILLSQGRDGTVQLRSFTYRRADLERRIITDYPVLRSEAISPAEWSQPLEMAGAQLVMETTDGDVTWQLPSGVETGVVLGERRLDWKHVYRRTNDYVYFLTAENLNTNAPIAGVRQITVDLIRLLTSDRVYDRHMAAQLLALNEGDPVFLGADWPGLIAAPYLAQGIDEKISPDEWSLTLNLEHSRNVLGYQDSDTPTIPARVWDQARYAWDTETRTWNAA